MKKTISIISFILILTSILCGCKSNVVTPSSTVPKVSASPAIASPAQSTKTTASPQTSATVKPITSPVTSGK